MDITIAEVRLLLRRWQEDGVRIGLNYKSSTLHRMFSACYVEDVGGLLKFSDCSDPHGFTVAFNVDSASAAYLQLSDIPDLPDYIKPLLGPDHPIIGMVWLPGEEVVLTLIPLHPVDDVGGQRG